VDYSYNDTNEVEKVQKSLWLKGTQVIPLLLAISNKNDFEEFVSLAWSQLIVTP